MDKEGPIKLNSPLKFWYQYQPTKQNFNDSLNQIAVFETVENFWHLYQHFKRPSSLEDNTYLYLFNQNIKPVWQDPGNLKGGAFVLRFEKSKSDKVWEDMLLGFISANIQKFQGINGIRAKIRKAMLVIEIWVRNAEDTDELQKLRDWIVKMTCLNLDTPIQLIQFHKE